MTLHSDILIPEDLIGRISELLKKITDGDANMRDLDEFSELWRQARYANRPDS